MDVDVGIALLPAHGPDVESVLGRAATALVAAKSEGQSGVEIYDPSDGASETCRLTVVAELRDALEAGELCVYYQPQSIS